MRVIETDIPDNCIRGLKYFEEGDRIRLTFQWPSAIEQVYIFKTGEDFDIGTATPKEARLFTLQEYKKQAGFIDRKKPGVHTYYIFPFIREEGEDYAILQPDGKNRITCLTGQITVFFSISEKQKRLAGLVRLNLEKIHDIKLGCEQYIEADTLCYVKKENAYPSDALDGVVYLIGEPLTPGHTLNLRVRTQRNEYIRIFIRDPEKAPMYKLQMN